jgi:hypothetical protein
MAAGAPDAADDANGSSQRDNPGGQKRQCKFRTKNLGFFLHFLGAGWPSSRKTDASPSIVRRESAQNIKS